MNRLLALLLMLVPVLADAGPPCTTWGVGSGAVAPAQPWQPTVVAERPSSISAAAESQRNINASVRVTSRQKQGQTYKLGHGSGTVIRVQGGKGYALTCRHVADEPAGTTFAVNFRDGKTAAAKVVGLSRDYDLAILEFDADADTPVVPLAAAKLPTGAMIIKVGYPGGQATPDIGRASVSRYTAEGQLGIYYAARGGDSGGGLFDARTGELAGVLSCGWGNDTFGNSSIQAREFTEKCFSSIFGKAPQPLSPDANLSNQVINLAAEVAALKARPGADPAAIAALEGRIAAMRAQVDAQIAAVGREAAVAKEIADAKADLAQLEQSEANWKAGLAGTQTVTALSSPYTGAYGSIAGTVAIGLVGWLWRRKSKQAEQARTNLGLNTPPAQTQEELAAKVAALEAQQAQQKLAPGPSPVPPPHPPVSPASPPQATGGLFNLSDLLSLAKLGELGPTVEKLRETVEKVHGGLDGLRDTGAILKDVVATLKSVRGSP